ncbi:MAG: phosphatase PAP2 family protein [Nitrospirae bacterium]|nr:phosphatase PAP2 family protein [Nitrospirota bacterium]
MKRLRLVELLILIFLLALLCISTLYRKKIPDISLLLSIYLCLIAFQVLLILLKDKVPNLVHDIIFPLIVVITVFDSLGGLVHYVNPVDIDPILIRLDYLLFGGHPTLMLESITHPLLTELLQVSYSTYYFIPLSLGIALKIKGMEDEFQRFLFLIIFCFFLSYVGYILMPALGPRFTIKHEVPLSGLFLATPIQELLNRLEGIKRDAFPSGHTAVALLVVFLSRRYVRGLFYVLMPITALLLFSTVYMRYHYVVDVIAGVGLTVVTVVIGERYYDLYMRMRKNITGLDSRHLSS